MNENIEKVAGLMNAIAAKYPLVNKSDLSLLTDIMQHFEEISSLKDIPGALVSMAERAAQLIQHMIMEETSFEGGVAKLGQCIESANGGLEELLQDLPDSPDEKKPREVNEEPARESSNDDKDIAELLTRFAAHQQSVLEDFEGYALDLEKNDVNARQMIQGILHTWKGEFGVLSLNDFSSFIHQVEESLVKGNFSTETALRLKDLLSSKLTALSNGQSCVITENEKEYVLPHELKSTQEKEITPESEKLVEKESNVPVKGEQAFGGDASLMGDFIAESREHLDAAEPLLLELESDPRDHEKMNTIFRACHTIKGVAGFLGLTDISHLAHCIEHLMDLARNDKLLLSAAHIDLLLESMDVLRKLVENVELATIGESREKPGELKSICEKLSSPEAFANSNPIKAQKGKLGEILIRQGKVKAEDIESALESQKGGDKRKIGEILVSNRKTGSRSIAGALASQRAAQQTKNIEETIRVPVDRLDQLIDSIGEAVIAQSMVYADNVMKGINDLGLEKKIARATQIMRQIQELSMSLRMVSIKGTFQKMARLVRDLSRKCEKEIEFVTEGEDTELDKSVVENIGDPLIHMIRNALDHGVEAPEDRETAGKPRKATVTLRAYHKAGNVFIEIEDDGKGMDPEIILRKAKDKGLCKEDENFSDKEILQFVFMPGFSTAQQVTDISGRGVGMDVVKRNIEMLRGAVDIQSEKGKGTLFTIRLPLTLAIINGMIVRLNNERYIIPTLSIIESLRPVSGQIETVANRGEVIKVRGELIRIIRLGTIFDNCRQTVSCTEGIVLIVEDVMGKKSGFLVDEILDQQQVVVKSLGEGVGDVQGLTGGAIMNDGTVSLIVDVGGVIKMADEKQVTCS